MFINYSSTSIYFHFPLHQALSCPYSHASSSPSLCFPLPPPYRTRNRLSPSSCNSPSSRIPPSTPPSSSPSLCPSTFYYHPTIISFSYSSLSFSACNSNPSPSLPISFLYHLCFPFFFLHCFPSLSPPIPFPFSTTSPLPSPHPSLPSPSSTTSASSFSQALHQPPAHFPFSTTFAFPSISPTAPPVLPLPSPTTTRPFPFCSREWSLLALPCKGRDCVSGHGTAIQPHHPTWFVLWLLVIRERMIWSSKWNMSWGDNCQ